MPAAMVLPIAAAMPNHIPRTWSRRPRPAAGVELTVEEASDDSDNVRSRGMRETQPSYRGEEKMQAGSGELERSSIRTDSAANADEVPLAPGKRFVDRDKVCAGNFPDEVGLAEPLFIGAAFELNHGGQRVHLVREAARERNL